MNEQLKSKMLPLIGVFKLLKAAGLFVVALGLHRLLRPDQAEILARWAHVVRVDPDNVLFHTLISKLTGLPHRRLAELSLGTFFYGALFATEGIGLLLKKKWAEYFATISTTVFLPLEIYELYKRASALKAIVLIANVAIVIYLIRILLDGRRAKSPTS
jgi:uncharacterized membrane protein (DUF2068 family)